MKPLTDKEKDDLIKSLQEQLIKSEKEKTQEDFYKPYRCGRCNMEVSFTYVLPVIKRSGYCPRCYHEGFKR